MAICFAGTGIWSTDPYAPTIKPGTRLRQSEAFARVGGTGLTSFKKHTHITLFRAIGNYTRIYPETIWDIESLYRWDFAESDDLDGYKVGTMQLAGQLLGPHIIGGVDRSLGGDYIPDLLDRWQPRLIVVLDPNANDVKKLRSVCPRALIVQRIYVRDGDMAGRIATNPLEAAEFGHGLLMERAHLSDDMMFGQVENEVGRKSLQRPAQARPVWSPLRAACRPRRYPPLPLQLLGRLARPART